MKIKWSDMNFQETGHILCFVLPLFTEELRGMLFSAKRKPVLWRALSSHSQANCYATYHSPCTHTKMMASNIKLIQLYLWGKCF